MIMDKRTLLMMAFSGLLIVIMVFSAWYKTELGKKNNVIARIPTDKSCDLQKTACSLVVPGGGEVTLSIEPRPIPLVQDISIKVKTSAIDAETIAVDFKGTTMNMGPNNVTLKTHQPGVFTGKGMLPVCIRNSMEWQADVYVQTSEGIVVVPFVFVTRKH